MPTSRNPSDAGVVRRLVQEIGISEALAWKLISLLGADRSSLVREAKMLLGKR
ncbi:hypothetical protein P9272_33465 [Mesorhizobium sp. WSM4976]|uniref:hypothetical protein n=1 Tax=Mesorhizobium sp. WSM4976 TaxID=3038549 RepID=UPI002417F31A|nr:hypothetical protein [Mesorhizobium sp. WSM4976]MDG4898438.1 hypothetical protein [Mesorhizobium sp. WSM4976]